MDKSLKQYHLVNNAIGWLIGIIACAVYIMTAEATASWWDCGDDFPNLRAPLLALHRPLSRCFCR